MLGKHMVLFKKKNFLSVYADNVHMIKGFVHPKNKILSFTHPHVQTFVHLLNTNVDIFK